ncbi:MAG: hypothetical protein IIU65_00035 [Clostridia bacterium]|nr:hypothetical protein [Clostridia bacterium]
MFYPESKKSFSINQFKNPDKTYRASPFWAWNTELEKEELLRQIEIFKTMGFGGFHIHSRVGMATPYLSEDFFDLVLSCNEKGKQLDMLTHLYDEDRWPSGTAGGFVTKNEKHRQMYLRFMTTPLDNGRCSLLGVYDIKFNENNTADYERIDETTPAKHQKWYAYIDKEPTGNGWFNNQCYVDMMNKEAIASFLQITHEAYKKHLGKEFGTSAPSIFTDEPQLTRKNMFDNVTDNFMLPWTTSFCQRYIEKYGEDIADKIPEIFFEKSDGTYSYTRYNFHELSTIMFAESFSDQYGKWCENNGIAMTGHIMNEGDLIGQTISVGDPLRHYLGFTMPGCDMLMNGHEFATIKQAASISRQRGREGVLCELDGVTNWDFDFRNHKLHGDWQAALGVTLRVPHLAWVSMNGEAKRDYPASISYQAAWCDKYHVIEDYFGRVNTCLTRGKAVCSVAVLHPVRNMWLSLGTNKATKEKVQSVNREFLNLTKSLVKNHVDFDFISESNITLQNMHYEKEKLIVENSKYDLLIIPEMLSISKDTLNLLKEAKQNGARVVTFGEAPKYLDAHLSALPKEVFSLLENKDNTIENIIKTVDEYRDFEIIENGVRSSKYCGVLREDGDDKWLFIAKAEDPEITDVLEKDIQIKIKGEYCVSEFCAENGEIYKIDCEKSNGYTIVKTKLFAHDSLLLNLSKTNQQNLTPKPSKSANDCKTSITEAEYSLCEDNVYLIDKAQYKVDDDEFQPLEEILRLDVKARNKYGIELKGEYSAQPWVSNEPIAAAVHTLTLKSEFDSKIDYENAVLGIENPEICEITFNGKKVDTTSIGWFVDKCIKKVKLGNIKKGKNTLLVSMPYARNTNVEYMYVLGNFGVYDTKNPYIDNLKPKLDFSDISKQGLLFYGSNIDYHLGKLSAKNLKIDHYKGGLIEVLSSNAEKGEIIYAPYSFDISNLDDITLRLYGTRINTFGQLHNVKHDKFGWFGSESWRTQGADWTYDYLPWEQGILSPIKIS